MDIIPSGTPERERLERNALRLLCSNLIQPVTRVELLGLLEASLFSAGVHGVVFEEITALGEVPARKLRELLPVRVTNRGFPDFDLAEFLGRDQATEDEIEGMFASVLTLIELRHGTEESGPVN